MLSGLILSAAALVLGACGDERREPTTAERLKNVQTLQATQPDFYVPRKSVDYMADLKDLKDSPKLRDEASSIAKAGAAGQPRTGSATPAAAAVVAPVIAPTQPVIASGLPATSSTFTLPTPPAPSSTLIASATPSASPAIASRITSVANSAVTVVNSFQPNFPAAATAQGIESAVVRARMAINASGAVTDVTILAATPARLFDREVRAALMRWKFNAGADARTAEQEIRFQR